MTALIVLALVAAGGLLALHWIARAVNAVAAFLRHFTLVWRFLSGHALDGQHRTNATWTRRGDKVLHPAGRVHPWHHLPRLHRTGIRAGAVTLVLAAIAGLITETLLTVTLLLAVAAAALGYGAWRAYRGVRRFRHHRAWVRPLDRALTPVLGAPPARLAIERDRSRVAIGLPETFIGEDRFKELIAQAVTTKLGLEAPEASWKLAGKDRQVVFTRSEPPPGHIFWRHVEQAVADAEPGQLLVGVGKRSAPVYVSIKSDSPHFGLAMGTGGGKSNTAAFLMGQRLMLGDIVLFLDAKWISHPWAFKDMRAEYGQLPNIAYARTTEQLHRAMVWLGVELQRRTEAAERLVNARGDILGSVGPRIWIVAEELNLATARLKQHWAGIRDPKADPKRSPALDGMAAVSFAGRAVDMNLVVIGQMLTAEVLGGGAVRENIGVRMLARYTQNSWKMQAGDIPMPTPSDVPGRVQVIASGAVREAQVPEMDFGQVREMAGNGAVTRCPDEMPGIAAVLRVPLENTSPDAPGQASVLGQRNPPGTMTLREAAAERLFPSLAAARKAVQRRRLEPAGREGNADLFWITDLANSLRGNND